MTRIVLFILMLLAASCKKEETIQYETQNKPPVANAGKDVTIHIPETTTSLDGSKSYDRESGITSYAWRQISGHDVLVVPTLSSHLVLLERLREGDYEFELKVADLGGQTDKDTVRITVADEFALGKKPVITFICDQKIVAAPTTYAYLRAKAYVENDMGIRYYIPTGFKASQLTGPSQIILKTDNYIPESIDITASNLLRGAYAFKIEVERKGLMSSDTAFVQVINDSLFGKEFVFDTIWTKDATGYIAANCPERPDLFYSNQHRSMEVWLKIEEENWHQASDDIWGYSNDYYFRVDECESRLQIYTPVVNANHLLNKKVKIRIRYL